MAEMPEDPDDRGLFCFVMIAREYQVMLRLLLAPFLMGTRCLL